MKFDVVIGNPPYNKGIDIDFVNISHNISSKCTVMVTPAKWQTGEASQIIASQMTYSEFRNQIVPYMKNVIFYPCCRDVFDIYQVDGITVYLLDKVKHETCKVENRCKDIKYFNSIEERPILNGEILLNIGNEIIEYLGNYNKFVFPGTYNSKQYEIWINTKLSGYDWFNTTNPRYVLGIHSILDKNLNETCDREAKCVFESDDINECKSFLSWIYSKFTRFFIMINVSKLNNILTDYYFRFVPTPPSEKFDHIYTDQELYKAFNLPQKYIDIIEATIKERN